MAERAVLEKIEYGGWPNCLRLSDGTLEVIATTDVGPRVIRFAFVGGANILKEFASQAGQTGGDRWRLYGGHRLWHAPEEMPRTYVPDNGPVAHEWDGEWLRLTQPVEGPTGIEKEMALRLANGRLEVLHRLTNRNPWAVELAPWALSVCAGGGRAIVPQEPYGAHGKVMLPVRPVVLWAYTDMADPRWTWGTRLVQLRQDPTARTAQKAGMRNTAGWLAYELNGTVFVKHAAFDPTATYPDFGCNTEIYSDGAMLELETLGALQKIAPGAAAEHRETWGLHRVELPAAEADVERVVAGLV